MKKESPVTGGQRQNHRRVFSGTMSGVIADLTGQVHTASKGMMNKSLSQTFRRRHTEATYPFYLHLRINDDNIGAEKIVTLSPGLSD